MSLPKQILAIAIGLTIVSTATVIGLDGSALFNMLAKPATFVLILGGILSALILNFNRTRPLSSNILIATNYSLPWIVMISIPLALMGVSNALELPEKLGPPIANLMALIVVAFLIYVFIVQPNIFRNELRSESSLDSSEERVLVPNEVHSVIQRQTTGGGLRFGMGLVVLIISIILTLIFKHATNLIPSIILSPPNQVLFLGLISSGILFGSPRGSLLHLGKALFLKRVLNPEEKQSVFDLIKSLKISVLFAMTIGVMFGTMKVMTSIDRPEMIGPGIMIACIPLIYGSFLFLAVVLPLEFRFAKLRDVRTGESK